MPLTKVTIAAAADSLLPRHRIVNTLHFECDQDPVALQALLNEILDAYETHWLSAASRELVARAYDVGPPPQFPLAEVIRDGGLSPASSVPREIALCLSYYGERNLPRQRGRIYLALCVAGGVAVLRPAETMRLEAIAFGVALGSLTSASATWAAYSPTASAGQPSPVWTPVTNVWVDDEWDTIRSRGLDASTRNESAV